MSMCENVTSATSPTPPPDLPLHFRAMLRLGRKWRYVPDRHYTGFRFYDTEARFDHIHERAKYIHLIRQKRYEIHSYARRRFLEDVLVPLKAYGVKWAIKRYKFEGHYIEIIQVTCGWYCVLVVLRNWSNPLYEEEVARIVRALDACARNVSQWRVHVQASASVSSHQHTSTGKQKWKGGETSSTSSECHIFSQA